MNEERRTSSCRVFQELSVNVLSRKLHVPDHGATDKAVLYRHLRQWET